MRAERRAHNFQIKAIIKHPKRDKGKDCSVENHGLSSYTQYIHVADFKPVESVVSLPAGTNSPCRTRTPTITNETNRALCYAANTMMIKFTVVFTTILFAISGSNVQVGAQVRGLQGGRPGGGGGGGGRPGGGRPGGGGGGGGQGGGGRGGGGQGGGGQGGGFQGGGGQGGGGGGGGQGGGGAVDEPVDEPVPVIGGLDFQAVSADIESLILADQNRGPTLVRLAWHSSGTYDELTMTGGSNGATIRFPEQLRRTANAGLGRIIDMLEPVHEKYADVGLSYSDLYTLAGGKQDDERLYFGSALWPQRLTLFLSVK
jgi:hypothetical protein